MRIPPEPRNVSAPWLRRITRGVATGALAVWGMGAWGGPVESPSTAVAAGSPTNAVPEAHWAFEPLKAPATPAPGKGTNRRAASPIDGFIESRLRAEGLSPGPEADRETLIRRTAFLVTGLPPSPEEIAEYLDDRASDATDRMMDRYLASPRYGERWAKHWLDAAGYADSNGYFNADTDRPLAYRYRDYVIRSLNANKPFDRFVREQLAGDEMARWRPGDPVTETVIELLEATHFLRNGPDGSGESDGNPDEVRVDRYYALESAMQIVGSCLLGVTVQCAKCHDHKFEPWTQRDYYQLQSFLYPAFPIERWSKPNERVVQAALPGELDRWKADEAELDREEDVLRRELTGWAGANRPRGELVFRDGFDDARTLADRWSATAPGDDAPGGSPPVAVGRDAVPGARVEGGVLQILEGGGSGDRWVSTRQAFAWRPAVTGAWVQVTFDLVAVRTPSNSAPAERVGYFLATHDFDDNSKVPGGNILIDGHPGGPSSVQVDYPGTDAMARGQIGRIGYREGRRYGVRITRTSEDQYQLQHLVDGVEDGDVVGLKGEDLPEGGFGFEYCCGRGFAVDNVEVERSRHEESDWLTRERAFLAGLAERKTRFDDATKKLASKRRPAPGRIAWVSDRGAEPPVVPLLKRGNPKTPGAEVPPGFPTFLDPDAEVDAGSWAAALGGMPSTGRRLAWAEWLTRPGSRQSALLARVTMNRMWQHYFGVGLVATPDNLGRSGAAPTHPELLEWLASEFVRSGWDQKAMHRGILRSAVFRQSSRVRPEALERDPSNHALSRFPVRRLDAESFRDAVLSVAGKLGSKTGGAYVPTSRNAEGEVGVDESLPDAFARSVYLQQRRTQVPTVLGVFDAPSLVVNCTRRASTTMPLQSLALLNSEFMIRRAREFSERLRSECGDDARARLERGYLLTTGRRPDREERRGAMRFLEAQVRAYAGDAEAERRAWSDLCQSLLAASALLYLD